MNFALHFSCQNFHQQTLNLQSPLPQSHSVIKYEHMKEIIFRSVFLGLILSLNSNAAEPLKDNYCVPKVDSKRYLSGDFSTKYPKTVKFECTYECQADGRIDHITGVTSVTVNNVTDDARLVVCQGVLVRKVPWGYDFDKVEPFYAYSTDIKEIKRWAFANVKRTNKHETELLNKLKKDLHAVATSYRQTNVSTFAEAANVLISIADELPFKTKTLDKYIEVIVNRNGKTGYDGTSEGLILMNLSALAKWRIPTHLFPEGNK